VDLILSASVLEHLRNPEAVMAECARILKPGGFMINVVDMRDHFFKYPLEMLKYPDWGWRLLTTSEGGSGYQNRLRISEWTRLLETSNFKSLVVPNILAEDDCLKQDMPLFDKKYKAFNFTDLQVLHATIISNKRVPAT
jgi:SAM-dependent methyltransferase